MKPRDDKNSGARVALIRAVAEGAEKETGVLAVTVTDEEVTAAIDKIFDTAPQLPAQADVMREQLIVVDRFVTESITRRDDKLMTFSVEVCLAFSEYAP